MVKSEACYLQSAVKAYFELQCALLTHISGYEAIWNTRQCRHQQPRAFAVAKYGLVCMNKMPKLLRQLLNLAP